MSDPTSRAPFCFAMPILPGKTPELRQFWAEVSRRYAADVQPHMTTVRLHRLVACLQHSPIGDLLVQFVDTDGGICQWLERAAAVPTDYTRWMEQTIRDLSGIDWTRPENAPALQPLASWQDADAGVGAATEEVFVMPVLPGKADACRQYWAEASGPRKSDVEAHSRRVGLVRLVADLQPTPMGDLLVQYVATREGLNGLLDKAAASDLAVSRWIEQQFKDFSGIDFTSPESKPSIEPLFAAGSA
jgi:hypothetical protein